MRYQQLQRRLQKLRKQVKDIGTQMGQEEIGMARPRTTSPGPAPYGWINIPNGKLVQCSEEQAILKIICDMRKDGATWVKIAEALNDAGYKTRGDGEWAFNSVQRRYEAVKAEVAA